MPLKSKSWIRAAAIEQIVLQLEELQDSAGDFVDEFRIAEADFQEFEEEWHRVIGEIRESLV